MFFGAEPLVQRVACQSERDRSSVELCAKRNAGVAVAFQERLFLSISVGRASIRTKRMKSLSSANLATSWSATPKAAVNITEELAAPMRSATHSRKPAARVKRSPSSCHPSAPPWIGKLLAVELLERGGLGSLASFFPISVVGRCKVRVAHDMGDIALAEKA